MRNNVIYLQTYSHPFFEIMSCRKYNVIVKLVHNSQLFLISHLVKVKKSLNENVFGKLLFVKLLQIF